MSFKETTMSDTETEPIPLTGDRRRHRKLVRFDPTVTTGILMQILVLAIGGVSAFSAYVADRATQRQEVQQIKDGIAADKIVAKEALNGLQVDVKEIQRTLNQLTSTLAVINDRQNARGGKP